MDNRSRRMAMRGQAPSLQRGQSLVEVAIACLVMVPLFIGVFLLGQYMHLRQQTQAAASAAAWDAAASPSITAKVGSLPSQATAQDRMRALQFGDVTTPLRNLVKPDRLKDPMLTTFAGRDLVLTSNVTLKTYTNAASPALSEKILDPISKATGAIGLGTFPPDGSGLITSEVHVVPEHILGADGRKITFLDPLATMDLDFHGRTVLLADAWNADGAGEDDDGKERNNRLRSVRTEIRPLAPSEWAGSTFDKVINGFFTILGDIPLVNKLLTTNTNELRIGKAAPDVVPSDKLVRYGATAR